MIRIVLSVFIFILFISCNDEEKSGRSVQEMKAPKKTKISDIVRNPVTADEPIDTVNVAKMDFEYIEHDFGVVLEGKIVEHNYKFTNTGKVPLLISDARATCGCTVPVWPKKPIDPGKTGEIKVKFNTAKKTKQQSKPVTITANTYPAQTRIFIKGYVKPYGHNHD